MEAMSDALCNVCTVNIRYNKIVLCEIAVYSKCGKGKSEYCFF